MFPGAGRGGGEKCHRLAQRAIHSEEREEPPASRPLEAQCQILFATAQRIHGWLSRSFPFVHHPAPVPEVLGRTVGRGTLWSKSHQL